jgi:hypothetical protein
MDGIYANEEQRPQEVWISDDKSDNSVLFGHKSEPRKDVLKAVDILTNHKFDKREPKNNNNNNNSKNMNRNDNHMVSTITTQSRFNQEDAKNAQCYCCGKKGHYTNKCPEKGKIDPRTNGQ